jgi:two-component system, OmpR family, response regulator CpxR
MPVTSIFCGSYCNAEQIAGSVTRKLGYRYADDDVLIAETADRFGVEESKLWKAFTGRTSIFNKFTHERERSLAYLRVVLADLLKADNLLVFGYCGLMVPREISHVLNVCVIADMKYRAKVASQWETLPEKDALKKIHKEDESRALWVDYLYRSKDPWDPRLYDIVIPADKTNEDAAVNLICENIWSDVLEVTDQSRKGVEDFVLAAQVNCRLAQQGHSVSVSADGGNVVLEINKHVLRLSALEAELQSIAGAVEGVRSVQTKVGSGFYQTDIYRKFDFDLPSKVLLVDDEREFIQTLSERLQMRDLGSAVVYGGEEALSAVDEEEPDVMVLDLKMPGIGGLEVLRQVKEKHPGVQVIVLTGHGSKEVEKECLEMGACAYLEKPVDLDKLTKAMKEAYKRAGKPRPQDP